MKTWLSPSNALAICGAAAASYTACCPAVAPPSTLQKHCSKQSNVAALSRSGCVTVTVLDVIATAWWASPS
jgi:hypothetical protein